MVKRHRTRKEEDRDYLENLNLSQNIAIKREKEGDQYEHDGYTVVKHMVDTFAQKGKLEKDIVRQEWSMLSKYVDEPRNIDSLRRVEKWTKHLLDSKTYAQGGCFYERYFRFTTYFISLKYIVKYFLYSF